MIAQRDRPPARDRFGVADGAGEDFGRDGISGLLTADRAMRARDVSQPGSEEYELAMRVVDELIARAEGRPRRAPQRA